MYDTLFLDRDGVINEKLEGRYVTNFNEFIFIRGSELAIRTLHKIFRRIIIVTNQQGIGKGIMTDADLELIHNQMQEKLSPDINLIEKIYYCPHIVEANCKCRKPNIGMLENAKSDFPEIDINNSFLVGDSDTDIIAGKKFGLETIQVSKGFTLSNWLETIL